MADCNEVFSLSISARLERNGEPFGDVETASHQMTQTQAVIAQHACLLSTQRVLMRLGIAAAMKADPDFLPRYNAALAMVGVPPAEAPSASAAKPAA